MHQEKAQNIMGAFAYQINNCEHCSVSKNDRIQTPPILVEEKLNASTSSEESIRQDNRLSVRQDGKDLPNKG